LGFAEKVFSRIGVKDAQFINHMGNMEWSKKLESVCLNFEVDERSLISWSKVLSAFVKNGYVNRAEFVLNMLRYDVPLDSGCFSISLDGC
jgi:hypothetical protein